MALAQDKLLELIEAAFPGSQVELKDLVGDSDHYAITIISEAFIGKSRIQQHQMVYEALEGRVGGELHALSIQTASPQQ